ncbi:isopentenyl-diphosphate delta-isomerase [Burkholderia singularis]|uniref:Isopentenyl-diphosphate Delta-isomerase n=1 Tax=Burkholderia singularis TaxID=1503053 RepID=A0A103DXL1_9BURK|nr:isopentenyl-diphosphate Delta-isomerase [Burkholderia singularis]KVE24590.1 isopentenyl-diphosphate delta-isomerase [Burkholderia singularis]
MEERLILVDADDRALGVCGKLHAHREGLLHRAFSIFVFDYAGRVLLQQRAHGKYHSGGLWTNTCCGHPRPGETLPDATRRRLHEEMGFACELREVDTLLYRAPLDNGLVEHEFLHIHTGAAQDVLAPDPAEVAAWRWIDLPTLLTWIAADPDAFTIWFRHIVARTGKDGLSAWAANAGRLSAVGSASATR